jgi:uracil-DNA glycosylase
MNISNYKSIVGDWFHPLYSLLSSPYMQKLISLLDYNYSTKHIRPNKKNVFKAFRDCKFKDLRIVIIGNEPYHNYNSTGIAYATPDSFMELSPTFNKIEKCIERTVCDNLKLSINTDLNHWTEQGILPIYTSLTVEKGIPGSNRIYWKNFIREVINTINSEKTGIIFLLWGKEASDFKHLINDKIHDVMTYSEPSIAVQTGKDWNCPHFNKVNQLITERNGSEFVIKW